MLQQQQMQRAAFRAWKDFSDKNRDFLGPAAVGTGCGAAAGPRCCNQSWSAGARLFFYYTQYLYFKP